MLIIRPAQASTKPAETTSIPPRRTGTWTASTPRRAARASRGRRSRVPARARAVPGELAEVASCPPTAASAP